MAGTCQLGPSRALPLTCSMRSNWLLLSITVPPLITGNPATTAAARPGLAAQALPLPTGLALGEAHLAERGKEPNSVSST